MNQEEFNCSQFTEIIEDLIIYDNDKYKNVKYETDINNYNKYKMFALVGYRKNHENVIINDIFIINPNEKINIIIIENKDDENKDIIEINKNITINYGDIIYKLLGDVGNEDITKCTVDYIKNYNGTLFLSFYKEISFLEFNPLGFNSHSIFFRLKKDNNTQQISIMDNKAIFKENTDKIYYTGGNINENDDTKNINDDTNNENGNQIIEGGSDKLYKVYDNNNNNSNNNKNNKRHSFKRKNN
jgi:hypothetical protein